METSLGLQKRKKILQRHKTDVTIIKRPYDGLWQVVKLMYSEPLPKVLRDMHQGYPEYWSKRWICVRVFKTYNEAMNFVG
jgi:hypothetical protein